MKKIFNIGFIISVLSVCLGTVDVFAAKTTKKQSAIQFGTKVRTKTEAAGIYEQECYDKYYSCMDQFCIVDNELGGSCNCSDDIFQYETALDDIQKMVLEADRIGSEEVEKVKAGANADIIFNGTRKYDNNNNVIAVKATKDKNAAKTSMWSAFYDDGEEEEEDEDSISNKSGAELYSAAYDLCVAELKKDDTCKKDINLLTQMYSRQIVSDCKGLANSVEQKRQEAKAALADASAKVRSALKESLEESNQYDRGTCMVEYKKCMQSEEACGADWGQCVGIVASENMQNNKLKTTKSKQKIKIDYDISSVTQERLDAKRFICEKVLDKCVAVRDYVWSDFIREVGPTLYLAEQHVESQKRQSCLNDIATCIHNACKDDIAKRGTMTMDSCLSNPNMVKSFCQPELTPCLQMEPKIWDYVESKLLAMRVDACTQEVKDCITDENRCGPDYSNCIGMDYKFIHDMCPVNKLVVCKNTDEHFDMTKLDNILMGLFLNIDNKALENCERIAEEKMVELCGSTTDCNVFAADDYIGTGSIKTQKDGSTYRVTGMISFGSIKMGNSFNYLSADDKKVVDGGKALAPGELGVDNYIAQVEANNMSVPKRTEIISSIKEELNNIAGTINRTISLIESDQRIQYCINGRDLSNIKGSEGEKTKARFPNLLNQYRVMIAMSALRKAQDNYNKKVYGAIEEAAKNSSLDVAQYLCQRMANMGTTATSGDTLINPEPLTAPYAISYEVGSGLKTKDLVTGGLGSMSKGWEEKHESGIMKERQATFDRETRTCHICTTTTDRSCKEQSHWYGSKDNRCTVKTSEPFCEDIKM